MTERIKVPIFKSNTILLCDRCEAANMIVQAKYVSDLESIKFYCWSCGQEAKLTEETNIPKIDPSSTEVKPFYIKPCRSKSSEHAPEMAEDFESIDNTGSNTEHNHETLRRKEVSKGFHERADSLADLIVSGIDVINTLRSDIEQIARKMARDFSAEWEICEAIKNWNHEAIAEFIRRPFAVIELDKQECDLYKYTKIVICPKFFRLDFGIPIRCTESYTVYLVNPYSMQTFHVNSWIQECLGMPRFPDLHVYGEKIIGEDLDSMWENIPGTAVDHDHTEEVPSIKIINKAECHRWLVSNGVIPWTRQPISLSGFHKSNEVLSILESEKFRKAFKLYRTAGRILLSWKDINEAIRFCLCIIKISKGTTLVMVPSIELIEKTKRFIHTYKDAMVNAVISNPEKYNERSYIDLAINEGMETIILLNSDEMDISELARFNGRIIAVNSDPVMDSLEENYLASSTYAACGYVSIDPVSIDSKRKRNKDDASTATSLFLGKLLGLDKK